MRIGLIRERKNPPDTRVPFTPKQCVEVMEKYPGVQIVVESSPNRCYTDEEYIQEGIPVVTEMQDCEVLLGVKEVPEEELIEGKT
ncbi:MAG: alanine dehydrogenase, partial [Chitinophagaceae bacterium]|nr:alanine dehydrogenase [Chitinophagaceae bacterium]